MRSTMEPGSTSTNGFSEGSGGISLGNQFGDPREVAGIHADVEVRAQRLAISFRKNVPMDLPVTRRTTSPMRNPCVAA